VDRITIRWFSAIVQLAPIARADPKRIVARTNLAIALASRGHVDQAIAELRQILQIAPDYAPARDTLQQIDSRKAQ
jgi:cytochrome c-type biogenesis protein CcmH/NrfG